MMLLLVTLVILLTPLTVISLLLLKKTKKNIKYYHKHYSDYLSDKCKNSFFIHPTKKDEIAGIISSLDKNKSVRPYSVPNNIWVFLKKVKYPIHLQIFLISPSQQVYSHLSLKLLR